jgi:hypothetical protein
MVASFMGSLVLKNHYLVDASGFTVEFDAAIWLNCFRIPMKAKLRLDNVRRYSFASDTDYPVVACVNVSVLTVLMRFTF